MTWPQPRGLNNSLVWGTGILIEKVVTNLGNHGLDLCSPLHVSVLVLWHLIPIDSNHYSMAVKLFADCSGHIVEKKDMSYCKDRSWERCWGGLLRGYDHWLMLVLNSGNWRLLSPTPVLGMCVCLLFLMPEASPKDRVIAMGCWDHLDSSHDWTSLRSP